jgi:hypothetical protein
MVLVKSEPIAVTLSPTQRYSIQAQIVMFVASLFDLVFNTEFLSSLLGGTEGNIFVMGQAVISIALAFVKQNKQHQKNLDKLKGDPHEDEAI